MERESTVNFNSYPDCLMCGDCCRINVLSMTEQELARIKDYVSAEGIQPIDYHAERCCFQSAAGGCMVWPARAQICQLYHCRIPRHRILHEHPEVRVHEQTVLVDMHAEFVGSAAPREAFAMPLLDRPLDVALR